MRSGDRVTLRQLVLEGYFYRERHSALFGDWIDHHYHFKDSNGRNFHYVGEYIPIEKGQTLDCRASVRHVSNMESQITIARIMPIPALDDQPKLL